VTDPAPRADGRGAAPGGTPMIQLEGLTKRFPGQRDPAVEDLWLEIPEGEIVVLVGPSGCGKTTMRMINRLIEPTSGRIVLQGEDVTAVDDDRLRRRIGYVIQQIGLFPHMTVGANIATVPRLLGWDRGRVAARVDELLELLGLEPGAYRHRYPKELSGGQRQRVGVARAMAADPPVILMDEPFSAIDPITRDRLQNEFLRLQQQIRKTIVFVTHDIDEAVKLGDRIAILEDRSRIAQYDTPQAVLTRPANPFVAEFVGAGAAVRRLGLSRVGAIALPDWPVLGPEADGEAAGELLRRSGRPAVLVVDEARRPVRWLGRDGGGPEAGEAPATVREDASLHAALDEMLRRGGDAVVVVDAAGAHRGVLDLATLAHAARELSSEPEARPALDEVAPPA
jgi:osmoprotectant transport system ATP-binding protein